MRRLKALNRLPQEQEAALNALGFEWNHDEGCWQRMCRQLEQFSAENGHCLPPPTGDTLRLAHWVYAQRALCRAANLSADRIARLDLLKFEWRALDARWWQMCHSLADLHAKSASIDFEWDDSSVLARWCRVQRRERRRNRLAADRIAALDKLGFVWNARTGADKWHQRIEELTAFRASDGHCNVPVNYPVNRQLGLWVFHQRQFHKKGALPSERIKQLESLGFNWSVRAETWEKNFALFKAYVEANGHSRISGDHRRLAAWAYDQRVAHRKGSLAADRVARLTALKFNWELRGSAPAA